MSYPIDDNCAECGMPLLGGPCVMVSTLRAICPHCADLDDGPDCSDPCGDDGYDSDYEDQP